MRHPLRLRAALSANPSSAARKGPHPAARQSRFRGCLRMACSAAFSAGRFRVRPVPCGAMENPYDDF